MQQLWLLFIFFEKKGGIQLAVCESFLFRNI